MSTDIKAGRLMRIDCEDGGADKHIGLLVRTGNANDAVVRFIACVQRCAGVGAGHKAGEGGKRRR